MIVCQENTFDHTAPLPAPDDSAHILASGPQPDETLHTREGSPTLSGILRRAFEGLHTEFPVVAHWHRLILVRLIDALTFGPFESLFGPESVATPMLRFLLADDHEVVRRGLRSILESQPDCDVVGEAADGRRAVALTKELNPDVVILDITMPALNGLEALRQILRVRPGTKVLVVTMHDSNQMITQVLNAGARGYILKSDATRDLLAALELLRLNKPYFTTPVSQMLLDGFLRGTSGSNTPQSGTVKLSPRQREIVQLLAEGRSSKEVAVALHVAVKTAETHRANIMRRLGCHSITELVRYAIRNKIIEA